MRRNGRELWAAELPASGHSTPITYMGKDGKQYVVIAASGGTNVGSGLPISDVAGGVQTAVEMERPTFRSAAPLRRKLRRPQ